MFNQALRDRPAKPIQFRSGNVYSWFAPRAGRSDPVLSLLQKVRCKRAGKAGIRGRTVIRVAQSVFADKRGLKIARKLKKLRKRGCNVRVTFTMITGPIRRTLRGVPTRQLVYDWNGDGAFDRYLHMKAMTVRGRVGDRRQRIVFTSAAQLVTDGDGLRRAGHGHPEQRTRTAVSPPPQLALRSGTATAPPGGRILPGPRTS